MRHNRQKFLNRIEAGEDALNWLAVQNTLKLVDVWYDYWLAERDRLNMIEQVKKSSEFLFS